MAIHVRERPDVRPTRIADFDRRPRFGRYGVAMSQYLVELGTSLANVLERATSAQPEVFAGYVANLGFWFDEYDHLCAAHEGHDARLETMREASARFLEETRRTVVNRDEFGTPYHERRAVVTASRNALRKIIERGLDLGLLNIDAADGWEARLPREGS